MADTPRDRDTELGGVPIAFPSTCWSRFMAAPGGDDPDRAFADLAQRYWKPIYAYIRIKRSRTNEDAKDLTQNFFLWMIEKSFLEKADPRRGRFRAFVRVALDHFLSQEEAWHRRLKRGGGTSLKSLQDLMDSGDPPSIPDPVGKTPEEVLDSAWKEELLSQAMGQLEKQLKVEGRETAYRLFAESYSGAAPETPGYRELAQRHGLSEQEVFNQLRTARKRCRDIVMRLVAETVRTQPELDQELDALFGGEGP